MRKSYMAAALCIAPLATACAKSAEKTAAVYVSPLQCGTSRPDTIRETLERALKRAKQ